MNKSISIKDFRNHIATIATKVEKGESFVIIRRSKPAFKVVPYLSDEDEKWETIIDFTNGGKKKGEKIEDVLTSLKRLNK